MKCEKCEGRGWITNVRYYDLGCAISYERNVQPTKKCKKCNGSGFIIGNINEVLEYLRYLENYFTHENKKHELRQVKNCIKAIAF